MVDELAVDAWKCVHQIFQDNQNYRAAFLETELTTTKMVDFSSVVAYCSRLKSIVDQMAKVGSPVLDQRLVLRTIAGLPRDYSYFVTNIQQKKTLPTFTQLCSRLKLQDTTAKERARESGSTTALLVNDDTTLQPQSQPHGGNSNNHGRNSNSNNNNYRGRQNYNNRGKGHNNNNNIRGHILVTVVNRTETTSPRWHRQQRHSGLTPLGQAGNFNNGRCHLAFTQQLAGHNNSCVPTTQFVPWCAWPSTKA